LPVFLRHAEHLGDHFDREQRGEILDDIEPTRVDLGEVTLDRHGDHRLQTLDRARREDLVDQAAHLTVLRRIHHDDHLHRQRFVGPYL
jgi:hypothetical protein